MNIELTMDELEVIAHALHRLNAHNSKVLSQEEYRKEHIDVFGESVYEEAKDEWELVNKQLFPKIYELRRSKGESK